MNDYFQSLQEATLSVPRPPISELLPLWLPLLVPLSANSSLVNPQLILRSLSSVTSSEKLCLLKLLQHPILGKHNSYHVLLLQIYIFILICMVIIEACEFREKAGSVSLHAVPPAPSTEQGPNQAFNKYLLKD